MQQFCLVKQKCTSKIFGYLYYSKSYILARTKELKFCGSFLAGKMAIFEGFLQIKIIDAGEKNRRGSGDKPE